MESLSKKEKKKIGCFCLIYFYPAMAVWLTQHQEGCGFNSQSGHVPRLQVQSPFGACTEDNRLMILSHVNVSLFLFLSFPVSLEAVNPALDED